MDKAKKEYIVYLLTGSNIGNKKENLYHAKHLVDKHCGNVSNHSPIYQTAAWGLTNQPSFYNQALQLHTFLEPENLMQTLLNIEEMLGRVRKEKMGPRIIDIDILLIENYTSNTNL
ncbi:MAG TPA: 2-amino-4-hydroxy-6-hydroxymethyldihydropteridine diphosphokinase, partial [Chitinophagaceae bacterium]|nr:2-amino-4-hydroxy-6-hydroxymethyldihydropteridine diphosphokinase [Chitinophagaceae bacterium]